MALSTPTSNIFVHLWVWSRTILSQPTVHVYKLNYASPYLTPQRPLLPVLPSNLRWGAPPGLRDNLQRTGAASSSEWVGSRTQSARIEHRQSLASSASTGLCKCRKTRWNNKPETTYKRIAMHPHTCYSNAYLIHYIYVQYCIYSTPVQCVRL